MQDVSGDEEFDEFEKKLEQSYQQRIELASNSRPESSSVNNGGSGNNRLMSGKNRPSDLKPLKGSDFN